MNKSSLIDLLEQTLKVTGDVHFQDSQRSLLEIIGDADLNSAAVCSLITETNAYSNIIFSQNCLPFYPAKKNEESEYLLLSDFDAQVNFRKTGAATVLMLLVKAVESIFGKKPLEEMAPINERDIDAQFAIYANQFGIGDIISPIERSEFLTVSLVKQQLGFVVLAAEQSLKNVNAESVQAEDGLDNSIDELVVSEHEHHQDDKVSVEQLVDSAPNIDIDKSDPFSVFKI